MFLLALVMSLGGCFAWFRAYQTYLQLGEFDHHFTTTSGKQFSIHFKDPLLFNSDITTLAKVPPSTKIQQANGEIWRYYFFKTNQQGIAVQPLVQFYFQLHFSNQKLIKWDFSPLFLQIAPAEFLAASFRSLAQGNINTGKKQLKVNFANIKKITAPLPSKRDILSKIGTPLQIKTKNGLQQYHYQFQLRANTTPDLATRKISKIRLFFDQTEKLVKMSGRFVGLKLSIDYRKYRQ